MTLILMFLGLVILVKGADLFVDGSVGIAKKFKVPSIVIGLTLVAFGTSAPEAAVSIQASLNGANGIALGNVVGSNLFNLLFILGLTAIIQPVSIHLNSLKKELPFMLLVTAMGLFLAFEGDGSFMFSRFDGIVLLLMFGMYLYSMLDMMKQEEEPLDLSYKPIHLPKSIMFTLIGLAMIVLGADWTVKGAVWIAQLLGVSDLIIGLTIIAAGTSLPELVTSIVAAKKGESDIAIGNIVGSNIFNLLLVLGLASSITSIHLTQDAILDIIILLSGSILAVILMATGRIVTRKEGVFLVVSYVSYVIYRILSI
jgi:cation:H+ antiporter